MYSLAQSLPQKFQPASKLRPTKLIQRLLEIFSLSCLWLSSTPALMPEKKELENQMRKDFIRAIAAGNVAPDKLAKFIIQYPDVVGRLYKKPRLDPKLVERYREDLLRMLQHLSDRSSSYSLKPENDPKNWISIKRAAVYMFTNQSTIKQLIRQKALFAKQFQPRGRYMLYKGDLAAFLRESIEHHVASLSKERAPTL